MIRSGSGYEELRAVEARRDERLKALDRLAQARAEVSEELARKESALSAFADLDAKMQASRREIENTDRLIISCRRERDSLIARQAQIKQRQEQLEAARTRLAQVEAELGAARTEQEDYTYLARVFGPDEIQLCEIQAAGPQVSNLGQRSAGGVLRQQVRNPLQDATPQGGRQGDGRRF